MPRQKPFSAEQFTSTAYTTAEEKARWVNTLVAWIEKGYPKSGFTDALYRGFHVYMCYSAEYNLYQFYSEWFANDSRRLAWLKYVLEEVNLGRPEYTWSDVVRALKSWIRRNNLVVAYQQRVDQAIEERERALLAYLLAKYPQNGKQ